MPTRRRPKPTERRTPRRYALNRRTQGGLGFKSLYCSASRTRLPCVPALLIPRAHHGLSRQWLSRSPGKY